MISAGCESLLSSKFSGVSFALMKRIMSHESEKPTRASYFEELNAFALALSFYSTKAHNYVRRTFQLALAHPATICQWYQGVRGQPGFTEEALCALAVRVKEAQREDNRVICSLMFDEMRWP